MTASLKGHLLLAGAPLVDPNFRRTVVLIGEHNDDGALGVVLNRPAPVTVAEAVPPLAALVPPEDTLYLGGPVQPQSPVIVAELRFPDMADLLIFDSIGFLTGEVDQEAAVAVRRARVFAGYAGWGEGQLERELEEESWIVEPATPDDVFAGRRRDLWSEVLRRKGEPYRMLSLMPFDPSTN